MTTYRQDHEPVQDGDRFFDLEHAHRPDAAMGEKFTVRVTDTDGIELLYDNGDVAGPFARDEFDDARENYTQTHPETGAPMDDPCADE